MAETVVSEYSVIWLDLGGRFAGFIALIVGASIAYSKNPTRFTSMEAGALIVCSILLLLILISYAYRKVMRVTAAPEGLILKYLMKKKEIIIPYSDIVHAENVHEMSKKDPEIPKNYVKLNIDLKTGRRLTFERNCYSNYYELKEAIRRNRFHLDD